MIKNRTALVTGGAKRVGKTICETLAKSGYNIALHYNTSKEEANNLKGKLTKEYGVKCEIYSFNLNEFSSYHKLIDSAYNDFKSIDLLINNASVFYESRFLETNEEVMGDNFNVNFKSAFYLTQEFTKKMDSGHVINIIDSNYKRHASKFFTYMLSKKSLADFTLMAAKELAPDFRVNGIAPGALLPSLDMSEKEFKKHSKTLPTKKNASPQEVANTIIMLEKNPTVFGQIIFVDSGKNLL